MRRFLAIAVFILIAACGGPSISISPEPLEGTGKADFIQHGLITLAASPGITLGVEISNPTYLSGGAAMIQNPDMTGAQYNLRHTQDGATISMDVGGNPFAIEVDVIGRDSLGNTTVPARTLHYCVDK